MTTPPDDSTTRFSLRVDHYVRCRPSYPAEVWDVLVKAVGLHAGSVIADVGSGDGYCRHRTRRDRSIRGTGRCLRRWRNSSWHTSRTAL